MAYNEAVRSMIDAKHLQSAMPNAAFIRQYVANAEGLLADASRLELSKHGRFILAYEGIHCLAMAFLLHFGARPDGGDGHRTKALQIFIQQVGLNTYFRLLDEAHSIRNNLTYQQPTPPVSDALMKSAVAMLKDCLDATRKAVAASLAAP